MLKKNGYIKSLMFPWRGTISHIEVSQMQAPTSTKAGLLTTEVLAAPSGQCDRTENNRRRNTIGIYEQNNFILQ